MSEETNEFQVKTKQLYQANTNLIKRVTSLMSEDSHFDLRLADDQLLLRLNRCRDQLLKLANQLGGIMGNEKNSFIEGDESWWEMEGATRLRDVLDTVLEGVDAKMDDKSDDKKKGIEIEKEKELKVISTDITGIQRPQDAFEVKVDNGQFTPFVSKVYRSGIKYHAMKDLSKAELDLCLNKKPFEIEYNLAINLPNPYEFELDHIIYPDSLYQTEPILPYEPLKDSPPLKMITTLKELESMVEDISQHEQIAVDLEHHSHRSYYGFVCLMQISTIDQDYIIDTLILREELFILNKVFTNPKIVKVFHGADSDILWLQRDFSLYIVNLFDTYHASHTLSFPHHSLSYLLKTYCDFTPDKRFQLADWRERPLSQPMIDYARSDTHFLLNIYSRMKQDILKLDLEKSIELMDITLKKSNKVAKQTYQTQPYDMEEGLNSGGWRYLLDKWKVNKTFHNIEALKQIHAWRDHVAREQDESPNYILANHSLYSLALKLPTTTQEVIDCVKPTPPAVRIFARELSQLILKVTQAQQSEASVFVPKSKLHRKNLPLENEEEFKEIKTNEVYLPNSRYLNNLEELQNLKQNVSSKISWTDSALFGSNFFKHEPLNELNIALLDQVFANLSLNILPKNIILETQINGITNNKLPESELYQNPVENQNENENENENEDKERLDHIKVLSGKSKFGIKPHTLIDVFNTSTSLQQKVQVQNENQSLNKTNRKTYDYSNDMNQLNQTLLQGTKTQKTVNKGKKRNKDDEHEPIIQPAKNLRGKAKNKSGTFKR